MITDDQFIAAMDQAVMEKGPGHTAPGAYWRNGESFCIVGYALGTISKDLCPRNNILLAHTLLEIHGCSSKVQAAALLAQNLNDRAVGWGECVKHFRWLIENYNPSMDLTENLDMGYRNFLKMEPVRRQVIKPEYATLATGGTFTNMSVSINKATVAFTSMSTSLSMGSVSFCGPDCSFCNPVQVAVKKDHALVA